MSLKEMKDQSFPQYHYDEWKKKAEESLKGKPLEKLQRTTYENIVLKPLYTNEDGQANSEYPGFADFRRGTDPLGYVTNEWKIAQRIPYKTTEELKEKLGLALVNGQTALSFDLTNQFFENKNSILDLLKANYNKYPFAIDAKDYQTEMLSLLLEVVCKDEDRINVNGYVAKDPLALAVLKGANSNDVAKSLGKWRENIEKTNFLFPGLKTALVNTSPYHNGGANAVQELGIAAAAGVFYIEALKESKLSLEQIFSSILFKFSIGANYFIEIAKLRAARIIWNKIAEAYGAGSRGMTIAAETSFFTKTVYDPYVNLLRGGCEAFAAVIGGVQYLHVHEYDEISGSSPLSERISRNTQLILQEEANLQKVVDPAGGSWYVEQLTNELAAKAWSFFQEIEGAGGILEALKSNWIQEKISEVYEKRQLDAATRKQSIVGTNVYANLNDAPRQSGISNDSAGHTEKADIDIQAIPQVRLAEPYEKLRKKAAELKQQSGKVPQVGLICLGSLKQHKPRLDFVRGFLSAGGVSVLPSEPIQTAAAAKEFVRNTGLKHFCICGTNDDYQTLGYEVLQSARAENPNGTIYLAGLPDKEDQPKWIENGLKQFIHVKSNCLETLSSLLSEMEVSLNEQLQA